MSIHSHSQVIIVTLAALACALASCRGDEPNQLTQAPREQAEISEPPTERAPEGSSRLRTVYVPAYSHLPGGGTTKHRHLLSILLSVRNVDSTAVITLTHVDYFDTSGHRVRRYLDKPRDLRPLETAEFAVATNDEVGGSGANFLVYWEGPSDAHSLLTEAVMLGQIGAGYVTFTSRGVELERRPDPARFTDGASSPTPVPAPATSDGDAGP